MRATNAIFQEHQSEAAKPQEGCASEHATWSMASPGCWWVWGALGTGPAAGLLSRAWLRWHTDAQLGQRARPLHGEVAQGLSRCKAHPVSPTRTPQAEPASPDCPTYLSHSAALITTRQEYQTHGVGVGGAARVPQRQSTPETKAGAQGNGTHPPPPPQGLPDLTSPTRRGSRRARDVPTPRQSRNRASECSMA